MMRATMGCVLGGITPNVASRGHTCAASAAEWGERVGPGPAWTEPIFTAVVPQPVMRHLLPLLLLLLLVPSAAAKGRFWSYTLSGTAYDKATKDVLRNTTIVIGEHVVTTDSVGHYTVIINGVTCDKGSAARIEAVQRGWLCGRWWYVVALSEMASITIAQPLEAVRVLHGQHRAVRCAAAGPVRALVVPGLNDGVYERDRHWDTTARPPLGLLAFAGKQVAH